MRDYGYLPLLVVDCSRCGRPTVVTPTSTRPDLCHQCFGDWLAAVGEVSR